MNRVIIAAVAATIAAPVLAQGTGGVILSNPEFEGGFVNNGQCTSALAKVRNEQRLNPEKRGDDYKTLSASEFQKESLRTTRCEQVDGKFRVVFYVNGIPG
ncbi:MAG TPA: hypothetical protein VM757_02700 [Sphingomicrobium sp.]|nr:hypothetical protein [Sphingomicrobium sp.]